MSSPRAVHQLVHTLSYGDAISTEVLALQRCMQEAGIESSIYALHEHPKLKGRTRPLVALEGEEQADIILHYSLGSPLNDAYRNWGRGRRILVYHNITPARWFRGVNERVAVDIERGIAELPALCSISDAVWADSRFNASEIETLGYSASVLDLPIDPARWDRPRNEGIFTAVSATPGVNVLHVGRLAPNKCVEDIIKSFYFLHRHMQQQSTLWLVGIDTDTELYSFGLRRLAASLGMEEAVKFLGCLADEEVRALYEACSLYICMSEHEGFCLPIIEAMHFGLPVIAYGAGAVPDTVGDGGIVVREKRHAEIAALMAEMASDAGLRMRLEESGKKRVGEFSFERFARRVAELLSALSVRKEAEVCAL
jgi:glycosyltransferase involved in cell wall biosynthesis